MNKKNIIQTLEQHYSILEEQYKVTEIGIFGSVVRSEHTNKSDVDILVAFSSAPGFFGFIRLEHYLSEILGKKIDLVTKKALKPAIRKTILEEVIYV